MSSVSRAIRLRCAGAIASSVRMLCSRSASLIRMTRTSRAIASSILRKLSACTSSRDVNSIWSSLDTPSTMSATGLPNVVSSSFLVTEVSSITSCSKRGGEALRVEPPLRQDAGDRQRMRDVRLARLAELAAVRRFRELERARDERDVRLGQVMPQVLGELRDLGHTWLRGSAHVGPLVLVDRAVNPAGWWGASVRSWSASRCRSCRPPSRAAR